MKERGKKNTNGKIEFSDKDKKKLKKLERKLDRESEKLEGLARGEEQVDTLVTKAAGETAFFMNKKGDREGEEDEEMLEVENGMVLLPTSSLDECGNTVTEVFRVSELFYKLLLPH